MRGFPERWSNIELIEFLHNIAKGYITSGVEILPEDSTFIHTIRPQTMTSYLFLWGPELAIKLPVPLPFSFSQTGVRITTTFTCGLVRVSVVLSSIIISLTLPNGELRITSPLPLPVFHPQELTKCNHCGSMVTSDWRLSPDTGT